MPQLVRDDVTIHYEDQGSGRPVLLIHGHTLDQTVFDDIVEPLLEAGLRVIRPDLRGHGHSSRPESGYHWSHHAADVGAVLEHSGVDHASAAVVGFSLGGGVALELAITTPGIVSSLALVSPVMPDRPFEPAFMDSIRQVARTARAEGIEAAMTGPWMASPLFTVSFESPRVRQRTEEIVRAFPGADYLATARDTVDRDWKLPDRLGEISVPTLVVTGGRELPGFTAYATEAAEGIPGARHEVIAGAGHLLPLEASEALARLLVEHLDQG